jgi:hypothetical protein
MNSGSRPGAPLGGHSTKVPRLPFDPVVVAAPAVDAPPPLVRVPAPDPRPPPEKPPLAPPALLVVVPAPVAPTELVAVVEEDEVAVVTVPARGVVAVAVLELPITGRATAPPAAGKPLRWAALPTAPVVGVALGAVVCAKTAAANAVHTEKAIPAKRIMPR